MKTDGVTFIIPNWNHELVLPPRTLRAGCGRFLREHGLGVEVLIVDDAARWLAGLLRQLEAALTDKACAYCALANNFAINGTQFGPHQGRVPYVIFMDADNEIVPENVIDFYRSIRTEAAVVYGNILIYDFHARVLQSRELPDACSAPLHRHVLVGRCTAAARRQRLLARSAHVWEDWELFLHLRRAAGGSSMSRWCSACTTARRCRLHEASNTPAAQLVHRMYRQFLKCAITSA